MKERKLSKTLQNERNIMKEISSDYVVTTYYLFKDKINYYFVMEYLPGGDVYNLLSSIILPFSTIINANSFKLFFLQILIAALIIRNCLFK